MTVAAIAAGIVTFAALCLMGNLACERDRIHIDKDSYDRIVEWMQRNDAGECADR